MIDGLRVRPVGLSAAMVETDPATVGPLAAFLLAAHAGGRFPRVQEVVPGARTILFDGVPAEDVTAMLEPLLREWRGADHRQRERRELIQIPVVYDGPDLAEVARQAGLDEAEVVKMHTGAPMRVAFCGFAPGFAYIDELPEALRLPRLATPRPVVPAGSVAIAEQYTGIYPHESPGGWRLLGRTTAAVWDPHRAEPALLRPGAHVRFVAAS